jgi:hypothetical protein
MPRLLPQHTLPTCAYAVFKERGASRPVLQNWMANPR